MAISFTRPDPSSPSSVASASFATARKGFEPSEVREFLRMVAAELARLQERERFLERELRNSQRTPSPSSVALDDELVTRMLGEEAARILHTARDAAAQIKTRSEEGAARLLREATDEAQRLREEAEIEASRRRADATADAEAELEMAKQQGREMVNEARAYRERVLNELARRREIARQQIEQLVHGRDRLLQVFERARLVAVDVMADLTPLGEPDEYVSLSPITGPVPLMVPNMPRPGTEAPASVDHASRHSGADPGGDPDATVALAVPARVPLVEAPHPDAAEVGPPAAEVEAAEVEAAEVAAAEVAAAEVEAAEVAAAEVAAEVESVVREAIVDEPVGRASDDRVVVLDIARHDGPDDTGADDPAATDDRAPAPVVQLFTDDRWSPDEVLDAADDAEPTEDDHVATEPDAGADVTAAAAIDVVTDDVDECTPDERDDVAAVEVAVDDVAPVAVVTEHVVVDPDATVALSRTSADDLFARLRAARSETVAQRAAAAAASSAAARTETPAEIDRPGEVELVQRGAPRLSDELAPTGLAAAEPAVFHRTPEAPRVAGEPGETPFARRDEALTPLIVAAARKLKRVLADEQNEVLHVLRRKEPVRDLATMLGTVAEQDDRYSAAVSVELAAAAAAGAASMGAGGSVAQGPAVARAAELLVGELVVPLRDRLGRCVSDADGDNAELASLVRLVYREWKNQRIDEHLDDVARTAFGHGALAAVAPGTRICWLVDPNGPECADAEDNSLAGPVPAGEGFPTDHPCAPAHRGCRCMIAPVD